MKNYVSKAAFSLVELSIVLVILGLLTGGILSGQSLIRAAELRSVASETSNYFTATQTFRDKYFMLPGDMSNATQFWGTAGGSGIGSACFTVDSSTLADPKQTCDGNGNGQISFPAGATSGDVWLYGERFRFWQHLGNAGLIEGSYSGRTDSTTSNYQHTIGKNVPRSRISGATYDAYYNSVIGNMIPGSTLLGRNAFTFWSGAGGQAPLNPTEAWNIDTKLDDGRPGTGNIQAPKKTSATYPDCSTTDVTSTSEYDLASSLKLCILHVGI